MFSRLSLLQKGLLLIAVPLICEIALVAWITSVMMIGDKQAREADQFVDRVSAIDEIGQCYLQGGFTLIIYGLTHSPKLKEEVDSTFSRTDELFAKLKRDIKVNDEKGAAQLKEIIDVGKRGKAAIHTLQEELETSSITNLKILDSNNSHRFEFLALIEDANDKLSALAETQREGRRAATATMDKSEDQVKLIMLAGVILNLVIGVFLALVYRQNLVIRLERVAANCDALALEQPLAPVLAGDDEIAELDHVFHNMAAELTEAARRERAVVEDAVDVIATIDAAGKVLTANRATDALWGKSRSDLIGDSIFQLVAADEKETLSQNLSCSQDEVRTFDLTMLSANSQPVFTRWTVSHSSDSSINYCVIHDISAEREIERLKNYFVSMVTHDLRTPLTSVNNMLSLMQETVYGELDKPTEKTVEEARGKCLQIVKMVSDFLDLEKINSGAFPLTPATVDLSSLLDAKCELLNAGEDDECFSDKTRGTQLEADQDLLDSALADLLNVLARYGTVQVTLAQASQEQKSCASIVIKATLPPEIKPALSQPFSELLSAPEETLASVKFDEMLRLSRARAIIHLHKGSFQLQTSDTILIILPLTQKEVALATA